MQTYAKKRDSRFRTPPLNQALLVRHAAQCTSIVTQAGALLVVHHFHFNAWLEKLTKEVAESKLPWIRTNLGLARAYVASLFANSAVPISKT
jgi:hypothetical protein